jgi:hypothetical protein
MDLQNVIGVAMTLIMAFGGGAAIVMGAASWLGKQWAERLMEKDRAKHTMSMIEMTHEHSQELEELRSRFVRELEFYRNELSRAAIHMERHNTHQFEIYSRIWTALYDFKLSADALWDEISPGYLVHFAQQLQNALDTTGKFSLYIEDGHYRELRSLLSTFANSEIGKQRLVELRSNRESPSDYDQDIVQQLIQSAQQSKVQYDRLIEAIQFSFRTHIGIGVNTAAPENSGE